MKKSKKPTPLKESSEVKTKEDLEDDRNLRKYNSVTVENIKSKQKDKQPNKSNKQKKDKKHEDSDDDDNKSDSDD